MSSPKPGETTVTTTNEAVIRAVLPRNGPKLLARLLDSPIETARHWYYKHLSASRRREVALALLAEMDRQDAERANLRLQLRTIASEQGDAEVGRDLAGATVQHDRCTEAGATPAELGHDRVVVAASSARRRA